LAFDRRRRVRQHDPGLSAWNKGETIQFGPPSFQLDPVSGTTNGTFASVFDLSFFSSSVNIDAIDYVTQTITIGSGGNSLTLQAGDVLISTDGSETLTSNNTLSVTADEVFLFRPTVAGVYTSGTFTMVLDNFGSIHGDGDTWSLALVERDTTVGDVTLNAGTILFSRKGGAEHGDIRLFTATGVGAGTTAGTIQILVEGSDSGIGISTKIYGMELIDAATTIGGVNLAAGTILMSVDGGDTIGGNNLTVTDDDVFAVTFTSTTLGSGSVSSTATMLLDGSDVSLSDKIDALAMFHVVNNAPALDGSKSPALMAENEDAGAPVGAVGTLISSLVDFASPAGQVDNVTDSDFGAVLGVAVSAADTSNGTWHYSTDGGSNWNTLGAVSGAAARLLAADASTRVYFQPNADYNGTLAAAITFRAWDRTAGSNGGTADTSTNGGVTAFSTATDAASLVVNSVNDEQVLATNMGATVAENSTGTTITSAMLITTDVDHAAAQLVYTLTGAPTNGTLFLNAVPLSAASTFTQADVNAGLVTYSHDGSETASDSFAFTVDDGVGANSAATFNITVTPVNDNSPNITSNGGGATAAIGIAENSTGVTTVSVTDADQPVQVLSYSISGGADAAHFSINSSSGALSFVAAPNREAPTDSNGDSIYEVTVQVSDGGLTDTQAISVTVTDVDEFDVGAVTDSNAAANAVDENAANGTTVGVTASASDADATTNAITYSLDDTAGGRFAIDGSTGVVTVANGSLLDRESAASHNIVGRATSADGSFSTQSFTINVNPLNDNNPIITSNGGGATATISTAENTAVVTTVTATDSDLPGQTLSYSIAGGADAARFSIDSSSGALSFVSAPNYESPTDANGDNVYAVTVQVSDGAGGTDSQTVSVNVEDLRVTVDSQTTGSTTAASMTLSHTASGNDRLMLVTVSLANPGARSVSGITYNGDSLIFVGAQANGSNEARIETWALVAPDLGAHNVVVTLTGANTTGTVVGVSTFTGVDQATPLGTFASAGGDSSNPTVNVSSGADELVFAGITVESGTNYNLVPGAGQTEHWDIHLDDANSGASTEAGAASVALSWSFGGSNQWAVGAVSIRPTIGVNFAPAITSNGGGETAAVSIAENTTAVTTVTANDADMPPQTLTYSIAGGDDGARFSIDSTTGVLTFLSAPDFESPLDADADNVYEVTIQVSDGAGGSDTQGISVTVTPVNDNSPMITSGGGGATASIIVAENATAVTIVTATDADLPAQTLTYSISGGVDAALFSIDGSTGALSFVAPQNREAPADADGDSIYEVTVQVSDGASGADSQAISVTVTDVDEFDVGAIIDTNAAANAVNENAANGTTVGVTAFASDADATTNTITYSLDDTAGSRFAIDGSTGVVTVANGTLLDGESAASHNVVVRATSADGSFSTQTLTINVNDVDEFDVGAVTDSNAAANAVNENAANGATVGVTASASDADATTNTIAYSLDDTAGGRFAIDGSTGVVTVAGSLDYETATSHTITVRAASADGSFSTQNFTIAVNPLNDNNPIITSNGGGATSAVSVAENSTAVTTVTATDADLPAQTLTYSISGGADAAKFSIDSSTGALRFLTAPDFESPADAGGDNVYDVTVLASDGAGGTGSQDIAVAVTAVNEAPSATIVPASFSATEQTTLTLHGAGLSIADVDAGAGSVQATISVASGTITATAGTTGVTIAGSGTATVTVTGSVTQINDLLAGNLSATLTYVNSSDTPPASDTLTLAIDDLGNSGAGGPLTASDTATISLTAFNDAPVTAGIEAAPLAYSENSGSVAITNSITVSDVDDVNIESAQVRISLGYANGEDVLAFANTLTITGTWNAITGTLVLTGTDTLANYEAALRSVTYENLSSSPSTVTRTIGFSVNDGDVGSAAIARDINISSVNDAPVLDASGMMTLTTITEDDTNNAGDSVASIISSAGGDRISDADSGALEGIAVTSMSGGNGTWQFSTDGGGSWSGVGAVSDASALLLRDTDLVRFVPDGQNGSFPSITFRAWDQSSGAAGTKVDASTNGGSTAFSTATESAALTVTAVNDAPVLDSTGTMTLTTITEDDTTNSGDTVFAIIGSAGGDRITDVDTMPFEGLAITSVASSNGTWQYSTTGGFTWNDVGPVSDSSALLLRETDRLRFVPDSQNADAASVTFRAWDQSSGAAGTKVDASTGGGTTAFSTATESASITVTAVNDAPVAAPDSYTVSEDSTLGVLSAAGVLANDSDIDGDSLSAVLVSGPSNGSLTLNTDGSFAYDPNADFFGVDTFTYRANDGTADSNIVTVTITVNEINDAPIAAADSAVTNEDTAVNGDVLANDFDPDNTDGILGNEDTLTAVLDAGPANGSLVFNADGTFTYTANANFFGTDSFTYHAVDSDGAASNVATVTITVNEINDAPIAAADSATTNEDTAVNGDVLANDFDPDNTDGILGNEDTLTAVLVNGPSNGTVVLNADGTFTYTPDANFNGADSFTYHATDGTDNSADVTVTLAVISVNDAPVATAENYAAIDGEEIIVPASGVLANDRDVDGDLLTAAVVSGPTHGQLILSANGSFSYRPDPLYDGVDTFTYIVSDGAGGSDVATVTITVNAAEVAPPPLPPGAGFGEPPGGTLPPTEIEPPSTSIDPGEVKSRLDTTGQGHQGRRSDHGSSNGGVIDGSIQLHVSGRSLELIESADRLGLNRDWLLNLKRAAQQAVRPGTRPHTSSDLARAMSLVLNTDLLWDKLDCMRDQLDIHTKFGVYTVGTATALTTALSAGYVWWTLRGGYLIASALSSIPAWRLMDPLPILQSLTSDKDEKDDKERRDKKDKPDEESLESLVEQSSSRKEELKQ